MINKKNLWFITLFSLILVLSVYYITMPSELLLTNNSNFLVNGNNIEKEEGKDNENAENKEEPSSKVEESEILVALRVEANDQLASEIENLKVILTSADSTVEEKNNAFEKMKLLNMTRGEEEELEKKILNEFNLNSFVKIDEDQIRVVVKCDKHSEKLANNIMRSIQEKYNEKKYISVKFQK